MNDNQGDKASNAMQLIRDLEDLVRERTEERNEYRKAYWAAKVYQSQSFWLGFVGGVSGVGIIMGVVLVVRWWRG